MIFQEAYNPFRALGSAFELLGRAPAVVLIGGILLSITEQGGGSMISNSLDRDHVGQVRAWAVGLIAALVLLACCVGIAIFVFNSLLLIGFPKALERVLATGREDLGDLFQARGLLGTMIVTRILSALVVVAAFLPLVAIVLSAVLLAEREIVPTPLVVMLGIAVGLAYVPVIFYFGLGVSLAPAAVAIEGMRPTEAMSRSWSLVRGHRLQLLLYHIVLVLFASLGLLACCVGVFATSAIAEAATFESYLRLVRSGAPDTWGRPAPAAPSA